MIKGITIAKGRNFSNVEIQYGNNVCVIGTEIQKSLFNDGEDPVGAYISFFGKRYTIVGMMENKAE